MGIFIAAYACAASSLRCICPALEFRLWLVSPTVGDQVCDVLHFIKLLVHSDIVIDVKCYISVSSVLEIFEVSQIE